jgi:hypothetical protein
MSDEAQDYAGRTGARRVCGAFLLTGHEGWAHRCALLPGHTGWHQCMKGHGGGGDATCRLRWADSEARAPQGARARR